MPVATSFDNFQAELCRLIEIFGKNLKDLKNPGYDELKLRMDFLDPFFKSLGWDVENRAGHITAHREVEVESRTKIEGGHKRADYLFRADGKDRFICEAKKPAEELHAAFAFQAKRYAYNKNVYLALLTDFEELKLYIVGGKPHRDRPEVGLWKEFKFQQYPIVAQELWDLLAYENIAAGSIDKAIETLPKRATGKGKARQQWLIKPDRNRSLDNDFLNTLDEARRSLASDLIQHNDRADLLVDDKLNIATQHILDRLLFLRICEDRDIDTGVRLDSIADTWRKNYGKEAGLREKQHDFLVREEPPGYGAFGRINAPKDSLYHAVVRHFRALDRRPPSHVPFFNGNLFKKHFSEDLLVSDEWLADFIRELSTDESPYLFNVISVEILGTIYERFLGKIVRPHGRGVIIEEKPEVRKAGGVYYTPSYIVDYIVEQTVGKLVDGKKPADTLKLTVLDPACGSGSFLIRAYERLCEHWQRHLTADFRKVLECASPLALSEPTREKRQRTAALQDAAATADPKAVRSAWEKKHRKHCWVDAVTGDVHLTVSLKREILTNNIYGVDLDAAAVEVTQLSLYLKMLENENRNTLARERELFAEEIALLPPLQDNIKNGNSLIASDFGDGDLFSNESVEQLTRIKAFDWNVGFPKIIKASKDAGFDTVIGNPPWISLSGKFGNDICTKEEIEYLINRYKGNTYMPNMYEYFVAQGLNLTRKNGYFSFVVPDRLGYNSQFVELRKRFLTEASVLSLRYKVPFPGITADTLVFAVQRTSASKSHLVEISEHGKTPMQRVQVELLESPNSVFEYFADNETSALVNRIQALPSVIPVAEVCDSTSGFGGKSQLITAEKENARQIKTIKGDSISRYNFRKHYWFDFCRENITGRTTDPKKLGAKPRILLRKTGNSIIATYDDSGVFPEQSLYFLFNNKTDSSFKFVLGVLNSKLLNVFFQAKCLTNKDSIAQVKKVDLDTLPIPKLDLKTKADKARHDKLVALVDKMLVLVPKLRAAKSPAEQQTLQNAVTATDHQIDQLVYELYGLTEEEIQLVEGTK